MIRHFFCLPLDVDGPGTSYMEASILIVSPELLPSQTCESEQSKLETLKDVFPGVNDVDVAAKRQQIESWIAHMLKTS